MLDLFIRLVHVRQRELDMRGKEKALALPPIFRPPRADPGDWVERKAGGLLKQLIDGIDAEGWRFVAFVRLVPLFPFNLSNYALGLTRIPLQHYAIATLVAWSPVQLPILGLVTLDAGR